MHVKKAFVKEQKIEKFIQKKCFGAKWNFFNCLHILTFVDTLISSCDLCSWRTLDSYMPLLFYHSIPPYCSSRSHSWGYIHLASHHPEAPILDHIYYLTSHDLLYWKVYLGNLGKSWHICLLIKDLTKKTLPPNYLSKQFVYDPLWVAL